MSIIQIQGLQRLRGEIRIQGSKNAVLPVMAAALLCEGSVTLTNVPRIQDVFCMMGILEYMGCACRLEGHTLTLDSAGLSPRPVPENEGKRMRSSVMLLGPLLGRLGQVETSYPGGCSIGSRPIDLHLSALERMGAAFRIEGGRIRGQVSELRGGELSLAYPSVGATENILMAAVAARGDTCLRGAAREPEIQILCRFLEAMGAHIGGIGESTLTVRGGTTLRGGTFAIPGDRIVAGTYVGAVMAAGGDVLLTGVPTAHMEASLAAARAMGCRLTVEEEQVRVRMDGRPLPVQLATGPYPDFPTDLQSVMLAVASLAQGTSSIRETVFEERFATAKELRKLGARIIIRERTAQVEGQRLLTGGRVRALDLRGGAALVAAGLAAEGTTQVDGCGYIQRGYEDICRDLAAAGARIRLDRG